MNLYQKLIAVRKRALPLKKANQGHGFKYVSSSQVITNLRTALDENQILLIPAIERVEVSEHATSQGKAWKFTCVWMLFTWCNADNPEEKIECHWYAQGLDDGEKGVGKALTYAEKYFLLKFFNIPTDNDDPDSGRGQNGRNQQGNHQQNNNRNNSEAHKGAPAGAGQGSATPPAATGAPPQGQEKPPYNDPLGAGVKEPGAGQNATHKPPAQSHQGTPPPRPRTVGEARTAIWNKLMAEVGNDSEKAAVRLSELADGVCRAEDLTPAVAKEVWDMLNQEQGK